MDDIEKRIIEILNKLERGQKGTPPTEKSNLPKILTGIDDYATYSSKEVASLLGFDPYTVTRWCREGKIRFVQANGYRGHYSIYGEEVKRIILKNMRKASFTDRFKSNPTNQKEDTDNDSNHDN